MRGIKGREELLANLPGMGLVDKPLKILHIDPDYRITYLIYQAGASIQSQLTIQQAINLLKNDRFDLILSEPHNKAILDPHGDLQKMDLGSIYPKGVK